MKNTHLFTLILPLISFNTFALDVPSIEIEKIIVGPQAKDPKDKFSLTINIINNGSKLTDWKLGFYMPRSFRTTSTSNTKLAMQICAQEKPKICTTMSYQKPSFLEQDLSTVFTTIIAPQNNFPLEHGKKYTISLIHNSSKGPQNYSALPQSFFIIADDATYNITTKPSTYTLTNYNKSLVEQTVQEHINQEWESSNSLMPLLNIVPTPQEITINDESAIFNLSQNLVIHNNSNLASNQLSLWQSTLAQDFKQSIAIDNISSQTGILLQNSTKIKNPEGYTIQISAKQLIVQASNNAGFFYALQTLRQLWQQNPNLSLITINDSPRFMYRGILLDTARHFFSVAEIKNFIDLMAVAKLNTLHLHISDDEAFRLQIPDYPQLTDIGSQRGYGKPIGNIDMIQINLSKSEKNNHNGSYSPAEIKDLIAYANLHQITIIPEIDIPGHSRALMKSLPNIFYESADTSEYSGYGDNAIPICAYQNNSAFGKLFTDTLNNILSQISTQFSGQSTVYAKQNELSIAGDEVANKTWDKSPLCNQTPWKDLNAEQKEHYFFDQLNNNNQTKHIPFSGWHEFILNKDGTIDSNGVKSNEAGHVWVWGKSNSAITNAVTLSNNNYPVVLAYSDNVYFDMTYTAQLNEPGFYWATKYSDTYAALQSALNATRTEQRSQKPQNIIGIEGALWTDVIADYQQLQYMAVPKIFGLSEAAWSSESVTTQNNLLNWQSLAMRLGCGESGILAYTYRNYQIKYHGYPAGISLEAPMLCNINKNQF